MGRRQGQPIPSLQPALWSTAPRWHSSSSSRQREPGHQGAARCRGRRHSCTLLAGCMRWKQTVRRWRWREPQQQQQQQQMPWQGVRRCGRCCPTALSELCGRSVRQLTPSKQSRRSSSRYSSSSSSRTVETSLAALPRSRRMGWQGERQPRHRRRWAVQQPSGGRCSSPSSRRAGQAPRQHCNISYVYD